MKMSKSFPIKMAIYTVVIAYLWLDLFVVKGPLSRRLKQVNPASAINVAFAKEKGVAARVFHQPIYLTQVDYALEEKFWRQGKNRQALEALSSQELEFQRLAVLRELIDDHLLRIKVRYNEVDFPVSEEEIDQAVERFASRFESKTQLLEAIRAQGWEDERELRARLASRIQREKYLEKIIVADLSEEDLQQWYEEHKAELSLPERRRLRHIFLAITDYTKEEGDAKIERLKKHLLEEGRSFSDLAQKESGDPASKDQGGHLGWVSKKRLPADLATAIFSMSTQQPQIIRSKMGWHLMEVLETAPPEPRSFADMKEEIKAALTATRREEGLKHYLQQLRHSNRERVEVFKEVLSRPWSWQ